jgi:hypothetical protein
MRFSYLCILKLVIPPNPAQPEPNRDGTRFTRALPRSKANQTYGFFPLGKPLLPLPGHAPHADRALDGALRAHEALPPTSPGGQRRDPPPDATPAPSYR